MSQTTGLFSPLNKHLRPSLVLTGFWMFLLSICSGNLRAQAQSALSKEAEIYLLTCSPGQEVWAHYGHTGIRVVDPWSNRDLVFNYGVFDFNSENFLWNFVRGEIDYILGVSSFEAFMHSYRSENRRVLSQKLNLTQNEKARLWQALIINSMVENRSYRYNFYYDNCSTRARKIIEQAMDGKVCYHYEAPYNSMREVIKVYTADHPWTWLGISFALSSLADMPASTLDLLFAPELMMEAFDQATIGSAVSTEVDSIQVERRLVNEQSILHDIRNKAPEQKNTLPGPVLFSWILFALILNLNWLEYKTRRRFLWTDALLFGTAGLAGFLIAFLALVSVHPVTKFNYLLIWIQPLHLLFALMIAFRAFRQSKLYLAYLKINTPVLLFALAGFCFLPQYVHPAMIPLLLSLLLRSLTAWVNPLSKTLDKQGRQGSEKINVSI